MNTLIDKIVDVAIKIQATDAISTAYGHQLIVCPAPKTPGSATTPDVQFYKDISELTTAGFTDEDPGFAAMKVAKAVSPNEGVYIAVRKNVSAEAEDILTTLQRALDTVNDWWAITPVGVADSDLEKMAKWVDELGQKYLVVATTGISSSPITESYDRVCVIHETTTDNYANIALCAACLTYAPGSETWDFKTLGSLAGQTLTPSDITAMESLNIGYYVEQFGNCITMDVKSTSGEWVDTIRFIDWMQDHIQRELFNLFLKNPKVEFDDDGISKVQSVMISALEDGRKAGGIANDTTEDDNIIKGFTVSVPKASSLSEAKRKSRVLPNCTFEARLSGAIHGVVIRGTVTN